MGIWGELFPLPRGKKSQLEEGKSDSRGFPRIAVDVEFPGSGSSKARKNREVLPGSQIPSFSWDFPHGNAAGKGLIPTLPFPVGIPNLSPFPRAKKSKKTPLGFGHPNIFPVFPVLGFPLQPLQIFGNSLSEPSRRSREQIPLGWIFWNSLGTSRKTLGSQGGSQDFPLWIPWEWGFPWEFQGGGGFGVGNVTPNGANPTEFQDPNPNRYRIWGHLG